MTEVEKLARKVVKGIFGLRIPGTHLHQLLALESQVRRLGIGELQRIFYYQPMFEAQCRSVGDGLYLQLCPDAKHPFIYNTAIEIGRNVRLSARMSFSGARNAPTKPRIAIGDNTIIGHWTVFRAGTELVVGNHVKIGSYSILSGDPGHPIEVVSRRTDPAPASALGRIEIGDDVFMGFNVTVLGNVKIGQGAVIGAGSVVVNDIPPNVLAVGNPARVKRVLDQQAIAETARNELRLDSPEPSPLSSVLSDRKARSAWLKSHGGGEESKAPQLHPPVSE